MKKIIFLTMLISFTISQGLFSQTDKDIDVGFDLLISTDTAQQIREIEKFKENIKNNINNFQKIEKYKDSLSFRNVYFKDKVLQLVKVQQIDNKVEKNVEWYFLDEQMIYAEVIWINIETKQNINHEKCYLNRWQMIAWVNNENKFIDLKSTEFKLRESELVAYGKKMYNDENR